MLTFDWTNYGLANTVRRLFHWFVDPQVAEAVLKAKTLTWTPTQIDTFKEL